MVSQAWGVITVTHLLDGLPKLRKFLEAQACTLLDKRLTRQLKSYVIEDPPVNWYKAPHLVIVHSIMDTAVTSIETKTRHIANLVQLGLYFYFGSCIYTN